MGERESVLSSSFKQQHLQASRFHFYMKLYDTLKSNTLLTRRTLELDLILFCVDKVCKKGDKDHVFC